MRWALAANDAWRVAEAHLWRAIAATDWDDIRERVEEATAHLRENGNLSDLLPLLSSSSYTALWSDNVGAARRAIQSSSA